MISGGNINAKTLKERFTVNNYKNGFTQYRSTESENNCECQCSMSVFPREISVAMAYVPFQQWCDVYSCDKALCQGTVFPVLDLPFMGVRQR